MLRISPCTWIGIRRAAICRVVLLQRADPDVAAHQRLDALHAGGRALHRGDARDAARDRGGADLVAVLAGADAEGRVEDEVDLAGQDARDDVVALAVRVLADDGGVDAVAPEHLGGALGREHLEAEVGQPLHREEHGALVAVGDADEDAALGGQLAVRRRLALGVGGAEDAVDAHHLAGRLHLRAEDGVDALARGGAEATEGQHRLLDRDRCVSGRSAAVAGRRAAGPRRAARRWSRRA